MNIHYVQSGIVLVLLMFLCGPVSAYYLTLDAPAQVKVGEPIQVTGSTNTPPPDKIDIVFSHSLNVPIEIERQSIQITEKGDTLFNITFKTDGLEKGNYKVEGLSQSQRDFSAGSRSLRVVKIIDRSDIVTFTSPTWQEFEKTLLIEAKIAGYTDNAIQMEVTKENETIFGPESIPVSRGIVKYELPIKEPGPYDVSFTDYDGFIGKYSIMVEEKDGNVASMNDQNAKSDITPSHTIVPVSEKTIIATPEPTPVDNGPSQMEMISGVSANAEVSRDTPAYFVIKTNKTPMIIQSSNNEDWVFEYKTSPDGAGVKINEEIGDKSETITITESISEVYLKVYPYSYKAAETVTITADTASTVALSDDAAKAFGVPPRYGDNTEQSKPSTPIPMGIILTSLIIGIGIYIKRR